MSKFFFTFKKRTLLVAGVLVGVLVAKIASNSPVYESEPKMGSFIDTVHADIPSGFTGGGQVGGDGCGDGGGGGCGL